MQVSPVSPILSANFNQIDLTFTTISNKLLKSHVFSWCLRTVPFTKRTPKFDVITIKKNEIGGACSAYGGGERHVQGFDGET